MESSALRERLSSALLDFTWDEWAQMGVLAGARRHDRWAQDPEALLLLTFEVAREDPRLFDEVLDWLVRNESLISTRRLRTLSDAPEDERLSAAVLAWLKRQSRPHADVSNWPAPTEVEPLFRGVDVAVARTDPVFGEFGFRRLPAEPSRKSQAPDLSSSINFAFRVRQLLGVSARAEAARYLLTADAEPASVAEVSRSSGYTKRNIQEALSGLHAAGAATLVSTGAEQRYAADRARWAYLLGLDPQELPVYREWPTVFGALRRILRWLSQPDLDMLSDYLRASRAADLLDEVSSELLRAGVRLPARFGGTRAWTDLEETVEYAISWLEPDSYNLGRPATFEIIADTRSGYWWRLRTAAGRIVATSAEAYAAKATARAAAERLRDAPERHSLRLTADAGAYRWSIVAENGRILATSAESFAGERDAERAADAARELIAGAAPATDARSASVDRARRHVTRRPDGRWQVQAEGATHAASTHATQADAVRTARWQARNTPGGAEVIVHRSDGQIRSSEVVRDRRRWPGSVRGSAAARRSA